MKIQNNTASNESKNEDKSLSLPQEEIRKLSCMSKTYWIFQIIIWIGAVSDKSFVKLELFTNIDFVDALTYSDYLIEKDEFYNKNIG